MATVTPQLSFLILFLWCKMCLLFRPKQSYAASLLSNFFAIGKGEGYPLFLHLILPLSPVSTKTQELSCPSPILVKAKILTQYHVKALTSRSSTNDSPGPNTVISRRHISVSLPFGGLWRFIALMDLKVNLYPRMTPFRLSLGTGFQFTSKENGSWYFAVTFCGGRLGTGDKFK